MAEDKSKTVIVKARAKAFLTSKPEEEESLAVSGTAPKKSVTRQQKSMPSAAEIAASIRKGEASKNNESISKESVADTKKSAAAVVKPEPMFNGKESFYRKNKLLEGGRLKKIPVCKMAEPMKRPADDTLIITGKVTAASKRIQTPVAAVKPAAVKKEEVKVVEPAAAKQEPKKAEAKPAAKKAEPKKAEAKPAVKKAEPKKAEAKPAAKKAEPKKAEAKPAAKKAEPKKAEAKPAAKKAEPKKAEAKPAAKKAEPKKAEAKPAAKKAEPKKAEAKPAAKKAEPKKAEAKPAAKKTEPKKAEAIVQNTYIQYQNETYNEANLIALAEKLWTKDMKKKAADLKSLELYIKPQERMVYCVFNKKETGSFGI